MIGLGIQNTQPAGSAENGKRSFTVYACLLNRVLQEGFVGMYSELVMANFFMEVLKSSPVGLPSPPAPGTLDIRQVLDSPYFFA
jgi:hypothetical protein